MGALLTVQQLLTPMTGAQIRANYAVPALQALGLQPQNWAQGSIGSSVLTVACNLLGNVPGTQWGLSAALSNAIAQQWNPTATGGGLQLLSKYFYGFTPPQGTYASGQLVLTNAGGGVYTFAAGSAFFASTVKNAAGVFPTYTNQSAFTINPGQTITITIVCTFLGSGGNAAPGFVTQIVTSMLGVTANNLTPIQGSDPLTDAALRQLNLDSLTVRSVFGPRSSWSYGIKTATNVLTGNPVNITKQSIVLDSHVGVATIYVSSPTGLVDPNDIAGVARCLEDGTGSTDTRYRGTRPGGFSVGPSTTVVNGVTLGAPAAATTVTYAPSIFVYVLAPAGTSATTIGNAILAQLTAYFAGDLNPIGGVPGADDNASLTGIFESGVSGVIAQGVGQTPGCQLVATKFTGTSDQPLAPNQVAVDGISSANLTVNVQYAQAA